MNEPPCRKNPSPTISLAWFLAAALITASAASACDFDYICGDGVLVPQCEECDDGNLVNGDGCDALCRFEGVCGDGVLDLGEPCDGADLGGASCADVSCAGGTVSCTAGCQLDYSACTGCIVCGDGSLDPGEECDDGNTAGGDGCSAGCTVEACGNGILDVGEDCDDGNTVGGDGCRADCTAEECGDGILDPGEECETVDLPGAPTCDDVGCSSGLAGCTESCTRDYSGCYDCLVCGDGLCDAGEDCVTCPGDCVSGSGPGPVCGNGLCEAGNGEDCLRCPADCRGVQDGWPASRFCCGDGEGERAILCADGDGTVCNSDGFSCTDVATPATFCCGLGGCEAGEDTSNCQLDCGLPPACGNGMIEQGEVCDGADLQGRSCTDLGCSGGTLGCAADCGEYDVAGCTGCCAARREACSQNADCCSGFCKRNGICR